MMQLLAREREHGCGWEEVELMIFWLRVGCWTKVTHAVP